MRKKMITLFAMSVVIVVSVLFLFPTYLFAPPSPILNPGNGHYYALMQAELSWQDAKSSAESLTYLGMHGYLATITSEAEEDFINNNLGLSYWAHYWIGGYQQWEPGDDTADGWKWVTGESWSFDHWANNEPNDNDNTENGQEDHLELIYIGDSDWNDCRGEYIRYYIVEFESFKSHKGAEESEEPQPWVRDHEMTCWQIWVNDDDAFEFIFVWEYYNNNWVKIYDMAGNEVFSIDMLKGDARFTAALPDGAYAVKTFHDGFETPIQEFVIGK